MVEKVFLKLHDCTNHKNILYSLVVDRAIILFLLYYTSVYKADTNF